MFTSFLQSGPAVILDGGLATELERRGADLRHPLWSAKMLAEDPKAIRQIHEDYFQAGADIGTSASYQTSFLGFAYQSIQPKQAAQWMRLSVQLVQEARDRFWAEPPPGRKRPLVAASIGCYGASLHDGSEYRGQYDLTTEELIDWHRPRLETLLEAKPDLLACETIPCLEEAEALVRLLEEFRETPAWLSFSCKDALHLCSGQIFVEAVQIAQEGNAVVAVGVNCTAPHFVEGLLRSVQNIAKKPLIVYPNSGEIWNAEQHTWEPGPSSDWAQSVRAWHAAGARLIGGCCRTTPDTIRLIRQALDGLPVSPTSTKRG